MSQDYQERLKRMNHPDAYSLLLIDGLINQFQLEDFSKEEIDYAIKRGYMKRVRKYECRQEQYSQPPP